VDLTGSEQSSEAGSCEHHNDA